MAWYYKNEEQEEGPVTKAELQQLIKNKQIDGRTMIRSAESDQWRPLKEFVRRKPQSASPPVPHSEDEGQATASRALGNPGLAHEAASPADLAGAGKIEDAARGGNDTGKAEQPSVAVCSQCGRSFPRDQVLTYDDHLICLACKPLFIQKLKEGAGLPGVASYAGFWIRVAAKLIDSIIIGASYLIFIIPLYVYMFMNIRNNMENFNPQQFIGMVALVIAATLLVQAAYTIWFIGRFGATLGKMACRLKVVLPDGGKVSYKRATGRFFGEWVTHLTFTIGYIIVAFDSEKRSLHDHICGTRVIRK